MKSDYRLIAIAIVVILLITLPEKAQIHSEDLAKINPSIFQAQNTSISNTSTEALHFGYTRNLYPVSSYTNEPIKELDGYCGDLFKHLKAEKFNVEPIEVSLTERFKSVVNGKKLAVVCGANTITSERIKQVNSQGGTFSEPFFSTGAKLLMKKKNIHYFYPRSPYEELPLQSQKIGVIKNTTTIEAIQTIFRTRCLKITKDCPSSEITKGWNPPVLQGFDDRTQAFEALQNDQIIAYASDELYLKGILRYKKQSGEYLLGNPQEYIIVPHHLLTHENIALIIYNQDLVFPINSWIKNEGIKSKKYLEKTVNGNLFSQVSNYLYQENSLFSYLQNSVLLLIPLSIILFKNLMKFLWKSEKINLSIWNLLIKQRQPSKNNTLETSNSIIINFSPVNHNENTNQSHSGKGDNVGEDKNTTNDK